MAPISQRKPPSSSRPNVMPLIRVQKTGKPRKIFPLWAKLSAGSTVAYMLFVGYFMDSFGSHLKQQDITRRNNGSQEAAIEDVIPPMKPQRRARRGSAKKKSLQARAPYLISSFSFDKEKAEQFLLAHGPSSIRKVIAAYLEPPMNDTIPGTGSQGDVENIRDEGFPPEFVVPLPLRTTTPEHLKRFDYAKFQTCADLPGKLPVDRGIQYFFNAKGQLASWNVGNTPTPDDYPWKEAQFCPVDADPFLPWIHDMFPSLDGSKIEFVAQNKRRCKSGTMFRKDLKRLEPQVALLQHVSVARLNETEARQLAPELWQSDDASNLPRYRLAPREESAPDGQETRFICRFYGTEFSSGTPRSIVLGETLSEYPFNYEFVSYRKMKPTMITPRGKDNKYFWTSNLRFNCPVPDVPGLRQLILSSSTILSDGTPTMHLDLIPIRTPARFGVQEMYFTEDMAGPKDTWGIGGENYMWRENYMAPVEGFNPKIRWGDQNVLPRVEASGRWVNLPICHPPKLIVDETSKKAIIEEEKGVTKKPHLLSACLWASASFKTRGENDPVLDTAERLIEWIEFHLLVGFDHIYVYDNSGAHSNVTSLAPILAMFPESQVTRIDWPSIVCNNNIPAHDNTGERSSQYAAENSCRTRHAPFTEWIAAFDTDEYLVPMGNYKSLREILIHADTTNTNILSFRSTRAKLLLNQTIQVGEFRIKKENITFMEAYNCDGSASPKPTWADRARKQLYRSDYVLYHFVHYSTVTQGIIKTYKEKKGWSRNYHESTTSERTTDEVNEATMLHTKTLKDEETQRWRKRCGFGFKKKWRGCFVGFPWPDGIERNGTLRYDETGLEYNCFLNEKISNYWVPKLRDAMSARRRQTSST